MKHRKQENKQAKKTFKKNQNYSRMPLTNDDKYTIMANMTNNDTTTKRGEIMNNFLNIVFGLVALLPAMLLFIL